MGERLAARIPSWAPMVVMAIGCSTLDPAENYLTGSRSKPPSVGTGGGDLGGAPGVGGATGGQAAGGGALGEAAAAGQAGDAGHTNGGAGSAGGSGGESPNEACTPPSTEAVPFTKRALRAAAADCAIYHYCVFREHADDLEAATLSLEGSESDPSFAEARASWGRAMASWQRLELFQFGPAANPSMSAGKDAFQGAGLRDTIYAWPVTARCRVDEQVVSRRFIEQGMEGALISGRGLYALETLLFYPGGETACAAASATAKLWTSLDPATLASYRIDYAVAVAGDVARLADTLVQVWSPEGENFRQTFVEFSGYPSEQDAMNVLGWSLSYLEKEVKDYKLGIPAGYTLQAPVSELEAVYSDTGHLNLGANLLGFRSLFQGCGAEGEGLGIDDWLEQAGHGGLAADMVAAWRDAYDVIARLPPLSTASQEQLVEAYVALKVLTDLLKNELLGPGSPINLDLPAGIEGDTD